MKNILRHSPALIILITITFTSCTIEKKNPDSKGIDLSDLDTTVSLKDNFFEYADGGWLKKNPLPASESYWGVFSVLQEDNYRSLRKVMEEASKSESEKGSSKQILGDFYYSGMDTVNIEKLGISPLQNELDRITSIKNKNDLLEVIALYQKYGVSPLFNFYGEQDLKNSSNFVPYLSQGGIGLPDRDYYFRTDSISIDIRKKYVNHISKMLNLLRYEKNNADKSAKKIMEIEKNLAKVSMTRVERRDPYKTYHKYKLNDLQKICPSINWNNFFINLEVENLDYVIVDQPKFFKKVDLLLKDNSLNEWKDYLRWNLINTFANNLSSSFVQENFNFYGRVLNGTPKIRDRWKRILSDANYSIGEVLGQEYVKKHFPPEAKKRCTQMVNNLISAFKIRIENLEWMSAQTKQKALEKLSKITKKIGYPDKWRDYSDLKIDRGSFVLNQIRTNVFNFNFMVNRIGKPIDRTIWDMTPQTVNAYYSPTMNEIVFPAGILQPPLFDLNADDAVNYGATGATIGHEMTHGFDDEGRQYNAEGNLKDWWTKEDNKKFKKRADVMVKQFDGYIAVDTIHVNGKLTLGENIADLGGLIIAHEAFKLTDEYKSGKKIGGFTPDQRFFIAYAQSWKGQWRKEALRKLALTDPHAPDFLRANSPLSNMEAFYKAFEINPGDKMYVPPKDRVKIW